ncbi:TIGR01212 family radical SAM protein [Desulfovibrionales bacterium]
MTSKRYLTLSTYFRTLFGHRVQKIPLDAGSSCPNRDGSLSVHGCTFCNQLGSGTGLAEQGLSLEAQYAAWRTRYHRSMPTARFMAYVQSYSNTYGPVRRLEQLLAALRGLPDLVGLAIGTRPDCLDEEKLRLLACSPWSQTWLDLGLQSVHAHTLQRIQRGHDVNCFAHWATRAAQYGLKVCAHVITGLPGETLADFKQTISFVNHLPVAGIKIHNLLICRGAAMEQEWRTGSLTLLSREETIAWTAQGLALLRPDIVVHRVNADPAGDELIAPQWARDKRALLRDINAHLYTTDTWQGRDLGYPLSPQFNP